MPTNHEFQEVFERLRGILRDYDPHLVVLHNTPTNYYLNTPYCEKFKKELCFGAATVKKNYVSYYFMPIYGCPEMVRELSPGLKARMQGKACFNFKKVDDELFQELTHLTQAGFDRFKKAFFFRRGHKIEAFRRKAP
jgi:hypothetical protein